MKIIKLNEITNYFTNNFFKHFTNYFKLEYFYNFISLEFY